MTLPRTILFDIDNTLLYTGGAGGHAMERAFAELSPEEQDGADDHWTRLRRQVRLFFDQV